MEVLQALEKKISLLIEHVQHLKVELQSSNDQYQALVQEKDTLEELNVELLKKQEAMEISMLSHSKSIQDEKEITRLAVDELIKNIDSLVSPE